MVSPRASSCGRRLGIAQRAYYAWLSGEQEPGSASVRKAAEVLQVKTDELLSMLDGVDPPFTAWPQFLETPEGKSLVDDERRALKRFEWPDEPSVASYKALLFAVRLGK